MGGNDYGLMGRAGWLIPMMVSMNVGMKGGEEREKVARRRVYCMDMRHGL